MFDKSNNVFYAQRSYLSSGDVVGVKYVYGPPYVKIVTTLVSSESNVDPSGALDEYSALYDNVIYFYSDKSFTTQISSDCLRKVLVTYYNYKEENGVVSQYSNEQEVIIQPGLSNYQLPSTYSEYRSEYGYTRHNYNDSYSIFGIGF